MKEIESLFGDREEVTKDFHVFKFALRLLRFLKILLCDNLRGVAWGGRWKGGLRRSGHMYTYDLIHAGMYGRNQHHVVKQLSSN